MKIPCHECGEREAGCHGKCERYAEYNAWREEIRQQREKDSARLALASVGVEKAVRKKEREQRKHK